MGNYTHLLGSIAEIAAIAGHNFSDEAAKSHAASRLVARCKEIAVVAGKQRSILRQGIDQLSSTQDVIRQYENISGMLHPSSDAEFWTRRTDKMFTSSSRCPWTNRQKKSLKNICRQITNKFKKPLAQFGDDGCPWFGQSEPMPADWSWAALFSICFIRL